MANAIESRLNSLGVYIEFNKELDLIEMSDNDSKNNTQNISALHFMDNETINLSANDVEISTIPITKMSELLKAENKLWYRNLKIPCILVDKKVELPGAYDWLYIDNPEINFHRKTLQNRFSELVIPTNHSILS